MFLLPMRSNTSPSVLLLLSCTSKDAPTAKLGTNPKCLSQPQLPSPEGPWQECTVRNLSLPTAVILIKYCGKTALMTVFNTALEIYEFSCVSFSSLGIPRFWATRRTASGNLFPNKPVTRRCILPRGGREVVSSSWESPPRLVWGLVQTFLAK